MDPEIIKAALQQVLSEMGDSARGGLAKKYMGGRVGQLGEPDPEGNGIPEAQTGEAGGAALDALAGPEGSPEEEADEPSDEELEEMMKK